ncbi:hypothetical protein P9H32_16320 [Pontiella sp. NLcol2]|uniref:Uncharacterized protein n=1 Tax=Pontiella agarivorans TaxID=3038953 RepID=A0ABU5N168_9BACT|nr:hypothetical protein [Pontiella agarivorans]
MNTARPKFRTFMNICDIMPFYSPLNEDVRHRYGIRPDIGHVLIVPSHRNTQPPNSAGG